MIKAIALLLVLCFNLKSTRACNGYSLKLNSVKSCHEPSVIKYDSIDVALDKDCNLLITGCADVTKPIKTAKGTYSIKKAPLPPLEGDIDFCQAIEEIQIAAVKQTLTSFGMPTKCPMPAKKACGNPNKKISIASFKNQLGIMAGTTEGKLDVEHDNGRTCVEVSFTLSKQRKG